MIVPYRLTKEFTLAKNPIHASFAAKVLFKEHDGINIKQVVRCKLTGITQELINSHYKL